MPKQSTAQTETHTKGQTYEDHSKHIGSEEIIIDSADDPTGNSAERCQYKVACVFPDNTA